MRADAARGSCVGSGECPRRFARIRRSHVVRALWACRVAGWSMRRSRRRWRRSRSDVPCGRADRAGTIGVSDDDAGVVHDRRRGCRVCKPSSLRRRTRSCAGAADAAGRARGGGAWTVVAGGGAAAAGGVAGGDSREAWRASSRPGEGSVVAFEARSWGSRRRARGGDALGADHGIAPGDRVVCEQVCQTCPVGGRMLGRVLDGLGRPIDGKGPVAEAMPTPFSPEPLRALARGRSRRPW